MTKNNSPMGAVLSIDHGEKRTGFASVDALRLAPRPLNVFRGPGDSEELFDHMDSLMEEREIVTLVVGWPVNMDGTEGARARDVKTFVDRLRKRFPSLHVTRYDERLTSHAANAMLREAGKFGKDRKARVDSWAALVILQDWMAAGEPLEQVG